MDLGGAGNALSGPNFHPSCPAHLVGCISGMGLGQSNWAKSHVSHLLLTWPEILGWIRVQSLPYSDLPGPTIPPCSAPQISGYQVDPGLDPPVNPLN